MDSPGATSGTANSDIASFTGSLTGTRIANVDPYRNIGGVTFGANNTNLGYAINGGTTGNLILSAGGVIQLDATAASGSHFSTVNVTVTLAGDAAFSNNATGTNRRLKFQAVNGSATVGNVSTLTIGGSNTSSLNEMVSPIGDGANRGKLALTMSGAGTWTLTSTSINTYTGATTVSAGRLLINGSTASGSAVSVAAGTASGIPVATLGGSGTIGGTLTLAGESASGFKNGGVLAPGGTGVDIKTLNAGTTTWNGGSLWNFDLSSANNTSDLLNITGDFVKGSGTVGSDYVFDFMGSTPVWNTTYTLAQWSGSLTGFTEGTNFSYQNLGIGSYSTSFFAISGSTLTWTAVPEPTSALAGLLLSAGLLRRRRS